MAGPAEQCAEHAGEAGAQCGDELGERADRAVLDEHGVDLGDARAGVVAPRHVEVLAPDDLGQIRGQDEVGIGVVDGQVEVGHLA